MSENKKRKRKEYDLESHFGKKKEDKVNEHPPASFPFDELRLRYGTESWKGHKPDNEDRYISLKDMFAGPVFGIFDGHAGINSANYLVKSLAKSVQIELLQRIGQKDREIIEEIRSVSRSERTRKEELNLRIAIFQQQLSELGDIASSNPDDANINSESVITSNEDDEVIQLRTLLVSTIQEMEADVSAIEQEEDSRIKLLHDMWRKHDKTFRSAFLEGFRRTDEQIINKQGYEDGSTAILVWFVGHDPSSLLMYVANTGDCRAILGRYNPKGHTDKLEVLPMSEDHKPSRLDERQRVLTAGGYVTDFAGIARVYSAVGAGFTVQSMRKTLCLSVSRAFGDPTLKSPSHVVICDPDVERFVVSKSNDLAIVLACDGVWDVLSNKKVMELALQHWNDSVAAAAAIVKQAYNSGSQDNLTVTVVHFDWQTKESVETVLNSLQQSNTSKKATAEIKIIRDKAGPPPADVSDDESEELDMFRA